MSPSFLFTLFINHIENKIMFYSFWNEFNDKLTDKNKMNFINVYLTKAHIVYVIKNYEIKDYEQMVNPVPHADLFQLEDAGRRR